MKRFVLPPGKARCVQCHGLLPIAAMLGKYRCPACRAKYAGWSKLSLAAKRELVRATAKPREGSGYRVRFTPRSQNRKTGPIPVSMTDQASCPPACPWIGFGCYAEYGHLGAHWRRVGRIEAPGVAGQSLTWKRFVREVAKLAPGTLWRHNEAGDLPGVGDLIDQAALGELVRANIRARARGFTFTHKPLARSWTHARNRHLAENYHAVQHANAHGFVVNLSADSLAQADALADLGIGPVAVTLPSDAPKGLRTRKGRKVVLCPAETHGMTCEDCALCAHPYRKAIIGFRAHGQAKKSVNETLIQLRTRATTAPLGRAL